jgi:hypothetical protein
MKANNITFDENLNMSVFSKELNKKIRIVLSDELEASEEELSGEYRGKIASFINDMPQWYNKVCDAIIIWAKSIYKIEAHYKDMQLMSIYILFEQNEKELFGLEFRTEFDIEHGCGLQINGKDSNFGIVKAGTGDIAFC